MDTEKIRARLEANARLMVGASPDEVIRTYRRRVAANANVCLSPISPALSGNNESNGHSDQLKPQLEYLFQGRNDLGDSVRGLGA